MTIGVISDTHLDKHPEKMLYYMEKYFNDVEMIIHAGDYTNSNVIDIIKKHKEFVGVYGNVDGAKVKKLLNEKEIITLEGYKLGIFHGHGDIKNTPERAYDAFINDKPDIIIFGHSHQPSIYTKNKVLMLNPGSLSRKRKEPWFSFIILNIDKGKIDAQLRLFKE